MTMLNLSDLSEAIKNFREEKVASFPQFSVGDRIEVFNTSSDIDGKPGEVIGFYSGKEFVIILFDEPMSSGDCGLVMICYCIRKI